jgi:DNA-damage-inducible protein J
MINTVVRARIDAETKDKAAAVLAAIGLTVSDAFRLMMVRIAKEKALPFEPLIPNARPSQRSRKRAAAGSRVIPTARLS